MTEEDLLEYNIWLMNVWNPKQLIIPFSADAPKAYLEYKQKRLNTSVVSKAERDLLISFLPWLSKEPLAEYIEHDDIIDAWEKRNL